MIPKLLNNITYDDIQDIINNNLEYRESKTIEYKRKIDLAKLRSNDDEKCKFVSQILSLANTNGGDLIIGINADNGIPQDIEWLDLTVSGIDSVKDSMHKSILRGSDPNFSNFDIHPIKHPDEDKHILIIRVRASYTKPHRITIKDSSKFYARDTAGKYIMDTAEIRTAMILSETKFDKIKQFKKERIIKIKSGIYLDQYVFVQPAKLVLHFIPIQSFDYANSIDFRKLIKSTELITKLLLVQGFLNIPPRANLEGILLPQIPAINDGRISDSIQIFRNGIVEVISTSELKKTPASFIQQREGKDYICWFHCKQLELYLRKVVKAILIYQTMIGISSPVVIYLSFIDALNYGPEDPDGRLNHLLNRINDFTSDLIELPELLVHEEQIMRQINPSNKALDEIIKPLCDTIWNCCGVEQSPNFNEEGYWKGDDELIQYFSPIMEDIKERKLAKIYTN